MEWSNDNVIMLIEAYKKRPLLWDTTNNLYKLKHKKNEAWLEIGAMFNADGLVLKQKMNSILASFRRECRKEGKPNGKKSSWFAFNSMDFLIQQYKRKRVYYSAEYSKDEQNVHSDEDEFFENRDSENEGCGDESTEGNYINIKTEEVDPMELGLETATVILPQVTTVMERPPKSKKLEELKKAALLKRKKNKLKQFPKDSAVQNALLKRYLCQDTKREENSVFGEHVAYKLRGYSNKTRNIVQHLINNILFDADMGKYDCQQFNEYSNST